MLLSQRYLASLLLFVGLLVVLVSDDSGPLASSYGAAAGAMLVCSTWLTIAVMGLEDHPHRAVLTVSAGGSLRVLLGSIGAALLWCLLLAVAGLWLPLLLGTHTLVPADLVVGLEAQLTCAFTGIAIGLLCSRQVVRRRGHALALALVLLLGVLLVKGLPPVNVLLTTLATSSGSAAALGSTSAMLAVSAAVLAAGAAVTQAVSVRKG
nr:hypothetical protein [Streptomyces sp. SID4948]